MAYNPTYTTTPLTEFESITPDTLLEALNLNWRERDLPERVRTKHVHRLHPYLGKFIPQLAEIFLRKYRPHVVCDPFCGSGTTLVEANALGIQSMGCDISPFNCLLMKVKTDPYDVKRLEQDIRDIVSSVNLTRASPLFHEPVRDTENDYLRTWFAPEARQQLLYYKSLIPHYTYQDVLKVILSRAARSARLTTHFDLDFPKRPQTEPYHCYKHGRICTPTTNALQFLNRYSLDTLRRVKEFATLRTQADVRIFCADSRTVSFPPCDAVITSPPYVGLIDYHEQHRYAYELLDLDRGNESLEIGAASNGTSKVARATYITHIGEVLANVRKSLRDDGVVVIVVHDTNELYTSLAPQIGYVQETQLERHVNRRTGRRSTDFFEHILIWRKQ